MAKRRLAMMSCEQSHTTPWHRCSGEESGLRVYGLGPGDVLILRGVNSKNSILVSVVEDGDYPWFDVKIDKLQIEKRAGTQPRPTSVEILSNVAH